jgi:hypothetical protein
MGQASRRDVGELSYPQFEVNRSRGEICLSSITVRPNVVEKGWGGESRESQRTQDVNGAVNPKDTPFLPKNVKRSFTLW